MASAVCAARESFYDVLLCDINLPDGNGWELLRQLERAGRCPPHAIAMSVLSLGEHVIRSKEAGYKRHLCKPFAPIYLERKLWRKSQGALPLRLVEQERVQHLTPGLAEKDPNRW